jgi:sialidase-1
MPKVRLAYLRIALPALLLLAFTAHAADPLTPTIKVIATPDQTNHTRFRRVLVGPGVNEPKPYPGYRGFVGWESVVRTKTGALLVAFSSGYWHASPPNSAREHFAKLYQDYRKLGMPEVDSPRGGRAEFIRSDDDGKTWSAPKVLIDTEQDDRHPALAQLSDGTLLASFFTWPTTKVAIVRSTDDGKTWEQTPHFAVAPFQWSATDGPVIEMPDRSVLLAAYGGFGVEGETSLLGVYRSTDKGESWKSIAQVKAPYAMDEPSIARLQDGTLVAIARREGALTWSRDQGRTWTEPVTLPIKMYDPWLLVLKDGNLLCCHGSYTAGKPGLRAILSADGGHTWSAAGADYGFSIDPDVYGYSRGIQMPDGSIFLVYIRNGGHNADQLKQEAILAVRMRVLPDCKGIELLPAPGG